MKQRREWPLPERHKRRDDREHGRQAKPHRQTQPAGRRTSQASNNGQDLTHERRDGGGNAREIRTWDGWRGAAGGQRWCIAHGEGQRRRIDERRYRAALARGQRENTRHPNDDQQSDGDVPELLRMVHADAEPQRRQVESARQKCGGTEHGIREGDGSDEGGQHPQPRGRLTRGDHGLQNLAALWKRVKDGQPQGDPVVNDVLVHPQAEAGGRTRRHERRS